MPRRKTKKFGRRKNEQSKAHIARAALRRQRRETDLQKANLKTSTEKTCGATSSANHSSATQDGNSIDTENQTGFEGFDVIPYMPSMRVLSLFDGIGTTMYTLEKMGFHIEVFYSSEINKRAIELLRHRYEDRMTMLGSVTELSTTKLLELRGINVLIGGSPCNDFSLVNFRRAGLQGSSGSLFFEYVRIMKHLRDQAELQGNPFFWLFENTKKMETKTRNEISRHLGCEPVAHNASHHLPVERDRLFWGNLPDMHKQAPYRPIELDDLLPSYRHANVKKVPTLTTTTHSQRCGTGKVLPVIQDGEESELFITEREKLFGLPEGYTDGGNLGLNDRRVLLGKTFCVPVLEHLLQPLKKEFWHK